MSTDKLLSIAELTELYSVSADTFRAWIARGELKAINLSRDGASKRPRYMIRQSDLDEFFRSRETVDAEQRQATYRREPYPRII